MDYITSLPQLEALYQPSPALASTAKEVRRLTPAYRQLIEASPFVALATVGPGGLDCSPRGDKGQVVRVLDEATLALPDRRGNNRIDSLRNIMADPRVALLFLIPGSGTTFRVNGRARLTADAAFCQSFAVEGKAPRCVIVISIETAYFQCARAVKRAGLWDAASHVAEASLPSVGSILQNLSQGEINGAAYDAEWPGRAAKTMW